MGLFGKLLKTGFDVVTTPSEIVKDVSTMGGLLTDEDKAYTIKRLERLADDAEEIRDDLDDL